MPRLSCSVRVRWNIAPFAARIAVRIRSATWSSDRLFKDPSSRATKRTAISLATSPAACPPIRHDKNPAVGDHEKVVLIPRPDDADVAATGTGDMHGAPLRQQPVKEGDERATPHPQSRRTS